jgi:hypothetical protein
MSQRELTQEEKDFKLDSFTLNNQFTYWLSRAKCMWSLRETNKKYKELRLELDHATAFESLKREMFEVGIS